MQIPQPPEPRQRLRHSLFLKVEPGRFRLELDSFYAALLGCVLPSVERKGEGAWSDHDHFPGVRSRYFILPGEAESEAVGQYIGHFKECMVLGKTRALEENFTDELDFCMALGANFEAGSRTAIGWHKYIARYRRREEPERASESIEVLARMLAKTLDFLPKFSGPPIAAYVAPSPAKEDRHLPRALAERMVEHRVALNTEKGRSLPPLAILGSRLKEEKPAMKDLGVEQKGRVWADLVKSGHIQLDSAVAGRTVLLIDDTFQSGSTIWWYAKFLKGLGAERVMGLVVEKTVGDADNLASVGPKTTAVRRGVVLEDDLPF